MDPYRMVWAGVIVPPLTALIVIACAPGSDAGPNPESPQPGAENDAAGFDSATGDAAEPAADGGDTSTCSAYARAWCGRLEACAPGFFFPGKREMHLRRPEHVQVIEGLACPRREPAPR